MCKHSQIILWHLHCLNKWLAVQSTVTVQCISPLCFTFSEGKQKDSLTHPQDQNHLSHTHRVEALNICFQLCYVYWKSRSLKLQSPRDKEETLIHYSSLLSSYNRGISGGQSMLLHWTKAWEYSVWAIIQYSVSDVVIQILMLWQMFPVSRLVMSLW